MTSAEVTKIAIIGTTGWGTTLAVLLAGKGLVVSLWARTEEEARKLSSARQNADFLPSVLFPDNLSVTSFVAEALQGAALVILAVPSQRMRANVGILKDHLHESTRVLSAAKGLELGTLKRMSCVIADELDPKFHSNICVLSGPNLSREIIAGQPAATVIASGDTDTAREAQALLMMPNLRVYTNSDVIGVELGGALKNIIALGAGMGDGLGYGDNAKAAFIIRGLAEITRLGVAAGANPLTFAGLAGAGDLIATCYSPLSRNRFVGEQLAKGRSLEEILASMRSVAEGIDTTKAALQMAKELRVEMPITVRTYKVLFEGLDLRQAVAELMGREAKPEMAEMGGGEVRISVVMPVYDEKKTIREILRRVRDVPLEKEIICVDDFSSDGTWEILQQEANNSDIQIFRHPRNLGKGAAIATGLRYVEGDVVIIQDADLEYSPEDYPRLIQPITDGTSKVVYGSRFLGKPQTMYFWNALGNKLFTFVANILFGCRLSDIETCYKVFTVDIARKLELVSPRWGFDPEITAKILKMGYSIHEVPISYASRSQGEKKIHWKDSFVVLLALIRFRYFD